MEPEYTKAHIRAALLQQPASSTEEQLHWLIDATPETLAAVRAALPVRRTPAAVLVPLVERDAGLTVLLTQRADTLKDHAGQISFPGGRIDPEDADAWAAALREAQEEVGLVPSLVEFAGYLPDHIVVTGFRVTPCVAFVRPEFQLRIAAAEVHDAFEVPLGFIMDSVNHRARQRQLGEAVFEVHDIPFGERNIWGATAGMLMTLRHMLLSHRERAP